MCEPKLQQTNIHLTLVSSTCPIVSYCLIYALPVDIMKWNYTLGTGSWDFPMLSSNGNTNLNSFCHGVHIMQAHIFCCSQQLDTVPVTVLRWKNKMCLYALICDVMWFQETISSHSQIHFSELHPCCYIAPISDDQTTSKIQTFLI